MTPEEELRYLLTRDFEFYARNVLKIKDKDANLIPFELNREQRHLWNRFLDALLAGKPLRAIILKGRQIGMSTFILAFLYWFITVNKNRGAFIVAHRKKEAEALFDRFQDFYFNSPTDLKPPKKILNREKIHFTDPDGKGLDPNALAAIDSADNEDLGASFTFQYAFLDEFARWDRIVRDMKKTLSSFFQTIPKRPGTGIFIVSTAQGEGRFKEMWDDNENGYDKIFFPFIAHDDYRFELAPDKYFQLSLDRDSMYGDEEKVAELMRPLLVEWYPEKKFNENDKELENEIMARLNFRRIKIREDCERDKNIFAQEYPLTPEEAFTKAGGAVFDQKFLSDAEAKLKDKPPVKKFFGFDPNAYKEHGDGWWAHSFYNDSYGPLTVYEEPDEYSYYVVGADPSEGWQDGDKAAAIVWKVIDAFDVTKLKQVAVWNKSIEPDIFAYVVAALGYVYNNALVGVECNGIGRATTLVLSRQINYYPLFKREVFNEEDYDKKTRKNGWLTSPTQKQLMLTSYRREIRYGNIIFNDIDTIKQHRAYSKHPDHQDLVHAGGKEDDLVMAGGIGFMMSLYKEQFANHEKKKRDHYLPIDWLLREHDREEKLEKTRLGYDRW